LNATAIFVEEADGGKKHIHVRSSSFRRTGRKSLAMYISIDKAKVVPLAGFGLYAVFL
jgi:hypothetical protein